jgi:hypothetical protein
MMKKAGRAAKVGLAGVLAGSTFGGTCLEDTGFFRAFWNPIPAISITDNEGPFDLFNIGGILIPGEYLPPTGAGEPPVAEPPPAPEPPEGTEQFNSFMEYACNNLARDEGIDTRIYRVWVDSGAEHGFNHRELAELGLSDPFATDGSTHYLVRGGEQDSYLVAVLGKALGDTPRAYIGTNSENGVDSFKLVLNASSESPLPQPIGSGKESVTGVGNGLEYGENVRADPSFEESYVD